MSYFKHDNAIVHKNAKIGDDTRIWAFANIQDGAIIGKSCNICDGCFVEKGAVVGNNATIKNNVSIFEGVTLEDDVFVGANVTFINDRNPRSTEDNWKMEEVTVRKGATIGAGSTIMCGLEIHEYAFIGAGSVVTKDVKPYELVVGNPGKVIGYACRCGKKLNSENACVCGQKYILNDEGLVLSE